MGIILACIVCVEGTGWRVSQPFAKVKGDILVNTLELL